jgi:hypothetical protein
MDDLARGHLVKPDPWPHGVQRGQNHIKAVHALDANVDCAVGENAPRVTALAVVRADAHGELLEPARRIRVAQVRGQSV